MTTRPVFDQTLADWLEDGPADAPEQVLETVLAAFPSIPQRRAALRVPWRFTPMNGYARAVAALAAVVVLALIGVNLLPKSGGIGGISSPSPTVTPSAPASTPSPQPTPTPRTATWTSYTSDRYGFSIAHPADWTVRPATAAWASGANPMTTTTEGFIAPGATVLVSAWSVAVAPGTSAETWIQTYCPKVTSPCTGISSRTVPVSMDGHAGLLVTFTGDVEAFILVNNRMYVVAEWRPDNDQTDLHYASGTLLVEDFLSTMHLLPGGPTPSVSPRPS